MASSRNTPSKRQVIAKPKVTANQLGLNVNALVMYKNSPYHIVAIDRTGTTLVIKKCEKSTVIRDNVALDAVRLVDRRDALYHKWGLIPVKADFYRTREDELFTLKALVISTMHSGKETRRDVLVDMMKKNMWMGVWMRACYDEDRDYQLTPLHLSKFKGTSRNPLPMGYFDVLAQLQFHRLKPKRAAMEWLSMLESMDEDVHEVANMVLDHKFGNITYSDARFAMKETGNVPWLPNRKIKGLME